MIEVPISKAKVFRKCVIKNRLAKLTKETGMSWLDAHFSVP